MRTVMSHAQMSKKVSGGNLLPARHFLIQMHKLCTPCFKSNYTYKNYTQKYNPSLDYSFHTAVYPSNKYFISGSAYSLEEIS